jgi:hypothetical protein
MNIWIKMTKVKYSKIKVYCKQNRHFYLDLSSEKYGTPLLY